MPELKRLYIFVIILVHLIFLQVNPSFAGVCDESSNSGGPSTVSENYETIPGWDITFRYDPESDDEIIAGGAPATIRVIGGKSPYTWNISGTGFSLDNPETTELSNQINADGTACGTAEITVTDNDGIPVKGYVREMSASDWEEIKCWDIDGDIYCNQETYFDCINKGQTPERVCADGTCHQLIEGKYKTLIYVGKVGQHIGGPDDKSDCSGWCYHKAQWCHANQENCFENYIEDFCAFRGADTWQVVKTGCFCCWESGEGRCDLYVSCWCMKKAQVWEWK